MKIMRRSVSYGAERTRETITGYPVSTDFGRYVKKVASVLSKHGPPDLVDAIMQNCAHQVRDAYDRGHDPEIAAQWAANQCTTIMGRLRPQYRQPKDGARSTRSTRSTRSMDSDIYLKIPPRPSALTGETYTDPHVVRFSTWARDIMLYGLPEYVERVRALRVGESTNVLGTRVTRVPKSAWDYDRKKYASSSRGSSHRSSHGSARSPARFGGGHTYEKTR